MTVPLIHHDYLGKGPARVGLAHPSISPYGGFESADGHTVVISIQSDREWRVLCAEVLGRPELGTDPRFASNPDRVANRDETDGLVAAQFAQLSRSELVGRLGKARIAFGSVNDVAGLSNHPQLRRIETDHDAGRARLPAPPVATDWDREPAVPGLDQHGPLIRSEFRA